MEQEFSYRRLLLELPDLLSWCSLLQLWTRDLFFPFHQRLALRDLPRAPSLAWPLLPVPLLFRDYLPLAAVKGFHLVMERLLAHLVPRRIVQALWPLPLQHRKLLAGQL